MSDAVKLGFVPFSAAAARCSRRILRRRAEVRAGDPQGAGAAADSVKRAAAASQFTGKSGSALDIVAPAGLKASRLIVIGTGKAAASRRRISSSSAASPPASCRAASDAVTIVAELPDGALKPEQAAALAPGVGCAPIRSTATRPSARRRGDAKQRRRDDRASPMSAPRARPLRRTRSDRRRRDDGARSRQRAAERALSRGIRAPRQRSCGSSASRSRCSTSRR